MRSSWGSASGLRHHDPQGEGSPQELSLGIEPPLQPAEREAISLERLHLRVDLAEEHRVCHERLPGHSGMVAPALHCFTEAASRARHLSRIGVTDRASRAIAATFVVIPAVGLARSS